MVAATRYFGSVEEDFQKLVGLADKVEASGVPKLLVAVNEAKDQVSTPHLRIFESSNLRIFPFNAFNFSNLSTSS